MARVLRQVGVVTVASVLALVLMLGLAAVVVVRASFPDYDGELRVRGLSAPVTVHRDEHGVPQVYAATAHDLFLAQGYLHATDRFWEMDVRRHVTAGRLSELFGPSQVETDAYIRTMGWRRVAEQEYKLVAPTTRRYLDAYAAGVNAWLADHSGASASLEYAVLALRNPDYTIEKWTAVDSLAWLKAMAWDLRSNAADELERAALLAGGLTRAQVESLSPAYPIDRHRPILDRGTVVDGQFDPDATRREPPRRRPTPAQRGSGTGGAPPGAGTAVIDAAPALAAVRAGLGRLPQMLGPSGHGIGSNSWVVAGSRTASGKPILANDPHLGPTLPSIWYQMGLHCTTVGPACPFDVAGFTFSGVPGVVIGHNARVAWGFTNLAPDVTDFYLEKVEGDSYRRDGRLVRLDTRTETIRVAGGDPVRVRIRSTVHGPLLSDRDADLRAVGAEPPVAEDGTPADQAQRPTAPYGVALRWTALDPSRTMDALFGFNAAGNWAEFRAAAAFFAVPSQNIVYADVDGNIGYQSPGDIPIRSGGADGRYPVPGWESRNDWTGRIAFEELPAVLNPPAGYIATANQQVVGNQYPYQITADWDFGYRSQRIHDLLAQAPGRLDVGAMTAMQLDSRNGNAPHLVPYLFGTAVNQGASKARALFRDWDHTQPEGSPAAAYYNAVWRHLMVQTFDELPEGTEPDGGARWFEVVRGLLATPDSPWWDIRATAPVETRDDVLRTAMEDAATELTARLGPDPVAWRWGDVHTLTLHHQTFGKSGLGPVEWMFNRGPYPTSGGNAIVNATGWNAHEGYEVTWVPSMRMVVDLDDLDRSRWVNLTGTSGHAFSPYYVDQTELWRTGDTTPMRWDAAEIRRTARHTQRLVP